MTHLKLRLVRSRNDAHPDWIAPARRPIARWVRTPDGSLRCLWGSAPVACVLVPPAHRAGPGTEQDEPHRSGNHPAVTRPRQNRR